MNSNVIISNAQIAQHIGESLAQVRLVRNLTQAALAAEAGISIATLKRLERGDNSTLDSLIRVMVVLGLAENFAILVPDASIRPLELSRSAGKQRQRARIQREEMAKSDTPWTWEDDAP